MKCCHAVNHSSTCNCDHCSEHKTHANEKWDQITRLGILGVCAFANARETMICTCGGIVAGVGIGAWCRIHGKPTPRLTQMESLLRSGIIESYTGQKVNSAVECFLKLFVFSVYARNKHHSEHITLASSFLGWEMACNLVDLCFGTEAKQAHCHHKLEKATV